MRLGLQLTLHCNAKCAHCCVDAGPDRRDLMGEADVYSYIDQAAEIPHGNSTLCFTGGEVFLYYPLLLRSIGHAASRFNPLSVVTNAFWARSEAAAYEKLAPLKEMGLTTMAVSTSPFHSDFIDPARVRCALAAADRLGLFTFVKCTTPNDGPSMSQLVRAIGPVPSKTEVQEMSFLPGGRASDLPPAAFALKHQIPEGRCPGAMMTISPNGDAHMCCTPGSFIEPLKLGNAKNTSILNLVREFYLRGILAILRRQGPSAFVPALERAGLGRKLLPGYVDVCHLCTSLLSDPEVLNVVQQVSKGYEAQVLMDLLSSSTIEIQNRYGVEAEQALV